MLLLKDLSACLTRSLRALLRVSRLLLSCKAVCRPSRRLCRSLCRRLLCRSLLLRGLRLLALDDYLPVVVRAFYGIGQNFVRLAESGKLFRRRRISRIYVGMKAFCKQSVCAFDFVFRRTGFKPHDFVVVLHSFPNLDYIPLSALFYHLQRGLSNRLSAAICRRNIRSPLCRTDESTIRGNSCPTYSRCSRRR